MAEANAMLEISNLHARAGDAEILKGIDLTKLRKDWLKN